MKSKEKEDNELFKVVIKGDKDGYFVASVPGLRGCHTQAKSLDVLMKRIKEVILLFEKELVRLDGGPIGKKLPGGEKMKAKVKVERDLHNLTVFFSKASTKLTLEQTIRKAKILISNIEEEIGPGRSFQHRVLAQHKRHVKNLIKVQKRSLEVFDKTELAEGWLQSPSIALGWDNTPMQLMVTDEGVDQVLAELVRIEHGIIS